MLAHELTLTADAFTHVVRQLASGVPTVTRPCGVGLLPERWEWLVGPAAPVAERPTLVAVAGRHPEVLATLAQEQLARLTGNGVVLALGLGPAQGHSAGGVRLRQTVAPLHAWRIVTAGFPRVVLGPRPTTYLDPETRARFSRTIGALGETPFRRLQQLHIAVVGCGRLGALVVEHLASYSLAALSVIDPDHMEPHNFGEMPALPDAAPNAAKASAIVAKLHPTTPTTRLQAITAPVQAVPALHALKAADVIISCPDNHAARHAVAQVAALYLKPVLDIGTGIVQTHGDRHMGFDVRWLYPGHCVNCTTIATTTPHRVGSLRSLNTFAVGAAMTMLEQALTSTLTNSAWLQVNFDQRGLPNLNQPRMMANSLCPICARLAAGDDGLRLQI